MTLDWDHATDAELQAAIDRERGHAERLRKRTEVLKRAGELMEELLLAALKLAPHLLEQIDDDPEGSARRLRDGLVKVIRSGKVF